MRVCSGVCLHGAGSSSIGIPFSKDGIHGAALDGVVPSLDVTFRVGSGIVGIIRQVKSLRLEFRDRSLQLWHRGADVGKFDDVCVGRGGEFAELGQMVFESLFWLQSLWKAADDPTGE